MIPIFIACLLWLPALVGLGIPFLSRLQKTSNPIHLTIALQTTIAGLLGVFIASTISAAANFFLAVHPIVSTLILLTGWLLLLRNRHRWTRLPLRVWVLFLSIVLTVSLIDARGIMWYDTGLYHLQAVAWLTHGPVPKGLANLYECLGYNCSWFTFAAAVETPLLLGKSCFIVNAIIAILFALPALDAAIRSRPLTPDRLMLCLMLIPLAQFSIDVPMMSSLSPDLIVMLLIFFSLALWVKSPSFLPLIILFSLFALTIKLSAVPFAAIAILAGILTRRFHFPIAIVCLCLLSSATFFLRGIWISGYIAYPAAISKIPNLSWTAPTHVASHAAREILFWSRYNKVFEHVQPGTPWLWAWFKRVGLSKPMVVAYSLFILGFILAISRRPRRSPMIDRCFIAMIALLPALAFWFQTAPQVRFGYGFIFGLAALSAAIGAADLKFPSPAAAIICAFAILLFARIDRRLFKASLVNWPALPTATLELHHLADGTAVSTPLRDDRVWNAPLPATVAIPEGLHCTHNLSGQITQWETTSP